MKKCQVCGKHLIAFGTELYLHPPSQCSVKDGYEIRIVDRFLAEKFREVHGKPSFQLEDLLDDKIINRYLKIKGEILWLKMKLLSFLKRT